VTLDETTKYREDHQNGVMLRFLHPEVCGDRFRLPPPSKRQGIEGSGKTQSTIAAKE
jgi:hypothetical protein